MIQKTLIIYYSRTGNTKAVCESLAKEINADIVEVKDLNNRMSTPGIIGGMLKTFLEHADEDISGKDRYDRLFECDPECADLGC